VPATPRFLIACLFAACIVFGCGPTQTKHDEPPPLPDVFDSSKYEKNHIYFPGFERITLGMTKEEATDFVPDHAEIIKDVDNKTSPYIKYRLTNTDLLSIREVILRFGKNSGRLETAHFYKTSKGGDWKAETAAYDPTKDPASFLQERYPLSFTLEEAPATDPLEGLRKMAGLEIDTVTRTRVFLDKPYKIEIRKGDIVFENKSFRY
jgi:hypothetical protein